MSSKLFYFALVILFLTINATLPPLVSIRCLWPVTRLSARNVAKQGAKTASASLSSLPVWKGWGRTQRHLTSRLQRDIAGMYERGRGIRCRSVLSHRRLVELNKQYINLSSGCELSEVSHGWNRGPSDWLLLFQDQAPIATTWEGKLKKSLLYFKVYFILTDAVTINHPF